MYGSQDGSLMFPECFAVERGTHAVELAGLITPATAVLCFIEVVLVNGKHVLSCGVPCFQHFLFNSLRRVLAAL